MPARLNLPSALLLLALLAVVLTAAGCGETVIDSKKTEDTIKQSLQDSLGVKVSSVECPSDVEVKKDATFTCAVVADGERQTARLKVLNEDADIELVDLSANK